MATHSSILDWEIPWTEEPGGLQSTGLQRVGHDRSDLAQLQERVAEQILKMTWLYVVYKKYISNMDI